MTVFRDDQNYSSIKTESGGHPWRWIEQGGQYVPSFQGHFTADLNLYRTLWENNILQGLCPSFFLHSGCDVNTPDGADIKPYSDPSYGACQNAESILFYANGLAVISRSKMFYDGPSGFGKGFGAADAATFGDGWIEHFQVESSDEILAQNRTDRKRSSMWSVIGDWTLRKHYDSIQIPYASAKKITVSQNADRRLEVFYIGTNDKLYHNAQVKPNSNWGGEAPLGGWAKQLVVGQNADGRLEVFYIGTNDKLYHNAQVKPNSNWGGEAPLGGWAKQLVVGQNADGRLEVFYIGTDDKLYHNAQVKPNSNWGGDAPLGGWAKQLVVGQNADGRLEVFYIGTNDKLYHNAQVKPNSNWGGEAPLDGWAKQLVVGQNADGRLEVFYIGTDDKLYHNAQVKPNSNWGGEAPLDGVGEAIGGWTERGWTVGGVLHRYQRQALSQRAGQTQQQLGRRGPL